MPGIRTDKERVWAALEAQCRLSIQIVGMCANQGDKRLVLERGDEVLRALGLLKESGRFDAKQVRQIQQLVRTVVRLERTERINGCASDTKNRTALPLGIL